MTLRVLRLQCLVVLPLLFACGVSDATLSPGEDDEGSSLASLSARTSAWFVTAELAHSAGGAPCVHSRGLIDFCTDGSAASAAEPHAIVQFDEDVVRRGSPDQQQRVIDLIAERLRPAEGTEGEDSPSVTAAPIIPPVVIAALAIARAINLTANRVGSAHPVPPPAPPKPPVRNNFTERTTQYMEPAGWCQMRQVTVIEDCRVRDGVVTNQCFHRLTTRGPVVRMDPCEPFNPEKHANVRVSYGYPREWAGPAN